MYLITQKPYGVIIKFDGFITPTEMKAYKTEMKEVLSALPEKFCIVMDMRTCKALPKESQDILNKDPELIANRLLRSVTLVDSAITSMQFKRLAVVSKVSDTKKFIDVKKSKDWETVAMAWIEKGEHID